MTPQEAEAFLGQFDQSVLDQPLTGEEVALALSDPTYEPTQSQFALYKEYSKNKQTDWFQTISNAVDSLAESGGKALEQATTTGAAINPANYAEGVLQNMRGTYGLVAQAEDPNSVMFRFKDLITGSGTEKSQYDQFLEARKFNAQSAKYERGEETILPKELVNPEFASGISVIADPTFLIPGVGEMFGAGKLATRAVGKAAQIAGRGVTAIAKPAERALAAAERLAVEATGMTPDALKSAAVATGAAGLVGGTPALAIGAALPGAISTASELGQALTAAGLNLATQPSRIGALEAVGRIPGASLRQRTIGIIGQYGGDLALDTALRSTAGAIEGAAIGGFLGGLSGGEEGAAAGVGTGGVLGAGGAAVGRAFQRLSGQAAAEARKGDFDRYVLTQDEKTAGNLLQLEADHGIDVASAYMDATALMRGMLGDVNVTLLDGEEYKNKFGKTRGVSIDEGERPAIYVNADVFGKGQGDTPLYTLGHEMFHALEKSEQLATKASDIKDALVGRYLQEGGVTKKITEGAYSDAEVLKRFEQYRDKLPATAADELSKYDTIQKKADFIASELAAEHLGILVSGQKPDALLRGLTGLKRELVDWALTQNSSKAISRMAEAIERTTGLKPVDSVLYPDLKQASPQVNAMLRDLLRARKRLDEAVVLSEDNVTRALKPSDMGNPVAAKTAVELGIAEQDPKTGSTRWFSDDEMRVREERDNKAVQDILTAVPGARVVDGVVSGRFSPEQLSAIEQSQQVSGRMKDKIRAVSSAMSNGNSLWVNYGAATRRVKNRLTGKYSSKYSSGIRLSQREVLPYSFNISKADNPYINVMDISKMRGQLEKSVRPDGSVANMWSSIDDFMSDLARYFTNLDRGESAKRSVEIFGEDKAKFLGDFVNEGEKGGRKYVRSLRIDRIGSVEPRNFKANISEDAIQKSKLRWMPDEQVGDKTVNKSEEGFTIVRGEKVRLYDPAGKLVGIYDNQAIAERKADDIQRKTELGIGRAVQESRFRAEPSIDGERFHNAIARTKSEHDFGFAVDDKGREFYTDPGTQLFLSNDGLAGVAVTDYGDLVSVFKHPSSAANIKPILSEAARFSQTLDAFEINGFLPNLYSEFGFKPVARVAFNREFAPPGWRYDLAGEPDVVLMVKDSKNVTDLPSITNKNYLSLKQSVPLVSYDEALALQNQYKKEIYATQTRLQPEVGQQQYQARDEVRQAAEAGDRNRVVSGAQSREEGGQALRPVRQEGDVRYMPEGKTDGLAILDDELTLNIPKRPTVMEIASALQDRFEDPIKWEKSTKSQNNALKNSIVQETVRAVGLHPEAKGWYDENIKLTVDVLKELDPDIANPQNDFIFKILLAATSDGNKVRPQFLQSWDEYTNWKNTGKISGQFVSGDRVSNIRRNLFKIEGMMKAVGWEKTRDFLTKKGTVSEIREALVKEFGWTKNEAKKVGTSELADEVVPYAIVLGPKLGSFFNNLYGDFSSVTMDRWFMRTMGRLTGTQVDTSAFKKIKSIRAGLRESISNLTPSEKEFLKITSDSIKGDKIDSAAKSISTRFAKKETRDRAAQLLAEGRPFMEDVRKRSNALKKIQSPLVEAPINGRHRRWIRQRIAEVQTELKAKGIELENADLQAVLWYLEKELYDKLNYRAKPGDSDYASAAAHLYERVVGRPSSVYAGSAGRIRSVGGVGRDVAVGAANPAEASSAIASSRYMPDADRKVTRAVNINDSTQDFTGQILRGEKVIETRDTLNNAMQGVLGQRIGLTRTGTGDTKVVGYATVAKQPIVYRNESEFRRDQDKHLVEPGSQYDIKKGGVKYGYELTNVTPVEPFTPKSVGRKYSVIEPRYMPANLIPMPDSSMPGAYSFTGGFRAIPGKAKGSLRLYGPAGQLVGIASSIDEAQRMIRRKQK